MPQFTREYGRMFGLPPVRDTEAARSGARGVPSTASTRDERQQARNGPQPCQLSLDQPV